MKIYAHDRRKNIRTIKDRLIKFCGQDLWIDGSIRIWYSDSNRSIKDFYIRVLDYDNSNNTIIANILNKNDLLRYKHLGWLDEIENEMNKKVEIPLDDLIIFSDMMEVYDTEELMDGIE